MSAKLKILSARNFQKSPKKAHSFANYSVFQSVPTRTTKDGLINFKVKKKGILFVGTRLQADNFLTFLLNLIWKSSKWAISGRISPKKWPFSEMLSSVLV